MPNAVKLRSPDFESITVVLGATKLAGAMDKVEDTVGVYVNGGESGDKDALITRCPKIVLPKTAGSLIAFDKGGKVYFDNTAKKVTSVSGGNTLCGRANEAAATTAEEVEVNFNGMVEA